MRKLLPETKSSELIRLLPAALTELGIRNIAAFVDILIEHGVTFPPPTLYKWFAGGVTRVRIESAQKLVFGLEAFAIDWGINDCALATIIKMRDIVGGPSALALRRKLRAEGRRDFAAIVRACRLSGALVYFSQAPGRQSE